MDGMGGVAVFCGRSGVSVAGGFGRGVGVGAELGVGGIGDGFVGGGVGNEGFFGVAGGFGRGGGGGGPGAAGGGRGGDMGVEVYSFHRFTAYRRRGDRWLAAARQRY